MSQPTGTIKQTPDELPPAEAPVVIKPNWFVRSMRATGRFFRAIGRGVKRGAVKTKNALVWAYDYVISRLDMLWSSIVFGVVSLVRWLVGVPAAIVRYFMDTNSETTAREMVEERQLSRAERKRVRQMEQRMDRVTKRRERGNRVRTAHANA
jgi:hypothetical protein